MVTKDFDVCEIVCWARIQAFLRCARILLHIRSCAERECSEPKPNPNATYFFLIQTHFASHQYSLHDILSWLGVQNACDKERTSKQEHTEYGTPYRWQFPTLLLLLGSSLLFHSKCECRSLISWVKKSLWLQRMATIEQRTPLYSFNGPTYLCTHMRPTQFAKQNNVQLSCCYAKDVPLHPENRDLNTDALHNKLLARLRRHDQETGQRSPSASWHRTTECDEFMKQQFPVLVEGKGSLFHYPTFHLSHSKHDGAYTEIIHSPCAEHALF